jgi:hypothetical protein
LKRNKTLIKESKIKKKKKTQSQIPKNKEDRSINTFVGEEQEKEKKKETSSSVTNHPSIDDMRLTT